MIFSVEQARQIRAGALSLALLPDSAHDSLGPGRLRKLRRYTVDEDGRRTVATVMDSRPDGDRVPIVLTILTVSPSVLVSSLSFAQAKAAGYRTRDALFAAWESTKPPCCSVYATVVTFSVGDLRDAPRLLSARVGHADYTETPALSAFREPEALTEAQLIALTRWSAAKDDARRRAPAATHAQNMARELDELRDRIVEDGIGDAALRTLMLAAERNIARIQKRLVSSVR